MSLNMAALNYMAAKANGPTLTDLGLKYALDQAHGQGQDTPSSTVDLEDHPEMKFTATSSESSDGNHAEFLNEDGVVEHPSRGSEGHMDGLCQPCCFFARAKCTLGKECLYCHYPHQRQHRPGKKSRERAKKRQLQDLGFNDAAWGDDVVLQGLVLEMLRFANRNPKSTEPPCVADFPLPVMPLKEGFQPCGAEFGPRWNTAPATYPNLICGGAQQRGGAIRLCL
mmetsp:Transcript_8236/g.18410  ORF Transcript_8236/g.18410 Transcript_8236/m.18410 type:complete len:225 (+) Transcript_8236:66-740(+)